MTSAAIGQLLGKAYVWYALVLAVGCAGGHLIACVIYGFNREKRGLLGFELYYGLLNPIAYLLVLRPGMVRGHWAATSALWLMLAAYWGLRGLHPMLGLSETRLREVAIRLLLVCEVTIPVVFVADICGWPNAAFCLPLYLLPFIGVRVQRRLLEQQSAQARFFLGELGAERSPAVVLPAVAAGLVFLVLQHPGADVGRQHVMEHREEIVSASKAAGVDPKLVAAIVYENQAHGTNAFRSAVEETAAYAWLVDNTSHASLAEGLDPSLGLAQIKPKTALTALAIRATAGGENWRFAKHYRDISFDVVERCARSELADVTPPLTASGGAPYKEDVVRALLTPAENIRMAAFLLALYARQWEVSGRGVPIRDRPEILATLYSLGFEKSVPHREPRANRFGERVAAVMREPWLEDALAGAR